VFIAIDPQTVASPLEDFEGADTLDDHAFVWSNFRDRNPTWADEPRNVLMRIAKAPRR